MGGSRHSKNAGTMGSESLTYHERRALGFGTVKERLGKVRDSDPVLEKSRRHPRLPTGARSRAPRRTPLATFTTAASHCVLRWCAAPPPSQPSAPRARAPRLTPPARPPACLPTGTPGLPSPGPGVYALRPRVQPRGDPGELAGAEEGQQAQAGGLGGAAAGADAQGASPCWALPAACSGLAAPGPGARPLAAPGPGPCYTLAPPRQRRPAAADPGPPHPALPCPSRVHRPRTAQPSSRRRSSWPLTAATTWAHPMRWPAGCGMRSARRLRSCWQTSTPSPERSTSGKTASESRCGARALQGSSLGRRPACGAPPELASPGRRSFVGSGCPNPAPAPAPAPGPAPGAARVLDAQQDARGASAAGQARRPDNLPRQRQETAAQGPHTLALCGRPRGWRARVHGPGVEGCAHKREPAAGHQAIG